MLGGAQSRGGGRGGRVWSWRDEEGGGAGAAREEGDGEAAEVGGQVRDGAL